MTMTKIAKLDKTALKNLRDPLEADLAAIGEKYGLKLTLGSGTYGDGAEASFKLILKVDDPSVQEAAARAQWDRNCRWIGHKFDAPEGTTGLRPEDFGTEFEVKGTRYRTVDLALKRTKYPVVVEVLTGPKKGGRTCFMDLVVPIVRAATDAKAAA
jgi:hypothetical protein